MLVIIANLKYYSGTGNMFRAIISTHLKNENYNLISQVSTWTAAEQFHKGRKKDATHFVTEQQSIVSLTYNSFTHCHLVSEPQL